MQKIRIGDYFDVYDGAHATPKKTDDGPVYLGIDAVTNDGRINPEGYAHLSEEDYHKWSKRIKPKFGDLVFSYEATLGRYALIPEKFYGCLGRRLALLRAKTDRINIRWLYYYFLSPEWTAYIINHTVKGSTVNRISVEDFPDFEIPYVDKLVQDSVVEVLSAIDAKIDLNKAVNDNLLQQAIALYEHLLQDAEWPTATILDVAEKVATGPFGSNIKVSTFVPEGVPIISGNHLRGYFLEEPEFNYITEEHAERLKNSIVFPHDLIFTHAGNIGQVAMIPDGCKYDRYVLSQRQFYLRCNETKVVPEFLLLFFHSASGQHELLSYANQTGVPSIAQPASNLKKIPFKCPPMQEQLVWQEQVYPLLGRYLNNRLENERLSSLRDTLLPKLMSGELDVFDLDL